MTIFTVYFTVNILLIVRKFIYSNKFIQKIRSNV